VFLATEFLIFSIIYSSFVFYEANAVSSQPITISNSGSVQTTASAFLYTSGINIYDSNNKQVIWNGITTKTLFGYEMYASGGVLPEDYSPSDIDAIRSHGLNFVRLDIMLNSAVYGQDYHNQTPTKLNYYPRFWTLLDSIVNEAQTDGMWVDINFCTSDGTWSPIGGYWGYGNGFPIWMYNGSWSYFNKIYTNDGVGLSDAIRDFWNINDATAANVRTAYQTFWKDIVYHFRNTPNVVFSLYNEPQCEWGRATVSIWGGSGQPTQAQGAQMYKTFIEQTIDQIQAIEGGKHIIIVNDAYFWYWSTNPKIDRPNVVVENHAYTRIDQYSDPVDNPTNDPMYFINLGWRYNQPFYLGEFGGIEENLQTRAETIINMQFCNSYNVSWCYLKYVPPSIPSAQTWTDLQNNLNPYLIYYH
jgi:hypothetical protein